MKLQKETKGQEGKLHGRWYGDACGTAFALELIGERWSLLIVRELMLGGRRFSDIRARLPGISAKVLAERLASLEAAGVLVKRQLTDPVPAALHMRARSASARTTMSPVRARSGGTCRSMTLMR